MVILLPDAVKIPKKSLLRSFYRAVWDSDLISQVEQFARKNDNEP